MENKGLEWNSLRRFEADGEDPVIVTFLAFVAADIEGRPEALSLLTPALAERLKALTEGVEVDLDAPIDGDVDL